MLTERHLGFLDLFDSGHLDFATATSIRFSPDGFKRFYDGWENYAGKLILRSQQVSNSPEIIRRLGVIGMNTPVEVCVDPVFVGLSVALLTLIYPVIYMLMLIQHASWAQES